MPFQQVGEIRYFTFSSLSAFPDLFHAVLTRRGGSSPAPWASLNLGGSVGDNPETVIQNKLGALHAVQRSVDSIFDVWQVHGSDKVRATRPRGKNEPPQRADIILSNEPQLTILMRFADCVPILLYDPIHKVVGLVHAGWQGTVKRAAEVAIKGMQEEFGAQPADIYAAIGPSIGPDHYQIGEDVVQQVWKSFGKDAQAVLGSNNGRANFDLWTANRLLLERIGVKQIELPEICTACHPEDWFSHRGEQGKTGRFGVLIGLR